MATSLSVKIHSETLSFEHLTRLRQPSTDVTGRMKRLFTEPELSSIMFPDDVLGAKTTWPLGTSTFEEWCHTAYHANFARKILEQDALTWLHQPPHAGDLYQYRKDRERMASNA